MPPISALQFPHGLWEDKIVTLDHGSMQDLVFSFIPQPEVLPPMPLNSYPRQYERPPPGQLQWVTVNRPYTALIPCGEAFRGPIFHRLDYRFHCLPIVTTRSGRYELRADVKQDWISLEQTLRKVVIGMMDISLGHFLPRSFELAPPPYRYRYHTTFRNEQHARIAAFMARDAFLPLMGAVSLMFLIFHHLEMGGKVKPDWEDQLSRNQGLHPAWISLLARSIVTDWDLPRLGGVVDVRSFFPDFVRVFRCVKDMPIILHWGKLDEVPTAPWREIVAGSVPSWDDLRHLGSVKSKKDLQLEREKIRAPRRELRTQMASSQRRPNTPVEPPHESASLPFPKVHYGSEQAPGIGMDEFFRRRWEQNERKLGRETDKERQSRLAREENARRHICPGSKGANVFFWDLIDGHRIRVPTGSHNKETYWEIYRARNRRYDSFRNQWDLCSEFDESEEPGQFPDEDDSSDDDEDHYDDGPQSYLTRVVTPEDHNPLQDDLRDFLDEGVPDTSTDLPPQPNISDEELLRKLAPASNNIATTPANPPPLVDSVLDTAYNKYGFQHQHEVPPPRSTITPRVASVVLGRRWPKEDSQFPKPLLDFLAYQRSAEHMNQVPPPLYDLLQPDSDLNMAPRCIRVRYAGRVEDRDYYDLLPLTAAAPMHHILVSSPLIAVEVLRRLWRADFESLAENLVDRCIPFYACIRGPQRTNIMPTISPDVPYLGRRPAGYTFTSVDFVAYEQLRNEYLRSSRGRVALLAGGLVGRLAREVVSFDEVFQGCSENVYESGIFISPGGTGYYDDVLSEQEINLICGVHHVGRGLSRSF